MSSSRHLWEVEECGRCRRLLLGEPREESVEAFVGNVMSLQEGAAVLVVVVCKRCGSRWVPLGVPGVHRGQGVKGRR